MSGLYVFLFACFALCCADTITIIPAADTFIDQQNPTTNYGTANTIVVGQYYLGVYPQNKYYYGLSKFDTPSVPLGKTLQNCTITYTRHPSYINVGCPNPITVRTTNTSWFETSVTWNNAPSIVSTVTTTARCNGSAEIVIDITSVVQNAITTNAPQGITWYVILTCQVSLMFQSAAEYSGFSSREYCPPPTIICTFV